MSGTINQTRSVFLLQLFSPDLLANLCVQQSHKSGTIPGPFSFSSSSAVLSRSPGKSVCSTFTCLVLFTRLDQAICFIFFKIEKHLKLYYLPDLLWEFYIHYFY